METASPPANRHTGFYYFLAIIAARVVAMPLVALALPFAAAKFGVDTPNDQQQAVSSWIGLAVVGFLACFVYLFVATVAHFTVLKRTLPTRLWVEVAVFLVFIVTLIYGGITAHHT
jgi:small-conductance mechanosensitive channel